MAVLIQASEAAYFDALWARRAETQILVYREVTFRTGARPSRHDCHANAARWAPDTSHLVHGWLVKGAGDQAIRLSAHSVLQNADGGLGLSIVSEISRKMGVAFVLENAAAGLRGAADPEPNGVAST